MLAFTFPGQGSQRPGMGEAWVDHPSWEIVLAASKATGRDVAALLLEADAEELTKTRNAQLATFILSLVILDAVKRTGIVPSAVAGHSLGEYTALVASNALSFDDGCNLVLERGEAMQSAAGEQSGTMYAVLGLDDTQVEVACRHADGNAWVANFNAPGQVVIAGDPEALARAATAAKELGAKRALPLPVGGAFHTPFMAPARARLQEALEGVTFSDADMPLVTNLDAAAHSSREDWLSLCAAQLCSPVRWRQSVETLVELGTEQLVELGPGNVLTGLAKRIAPDTKAVSVSTPDDLDALMESLAGTPALSEDAHLHEGEHLYVHERLVVSPATGLFSFLDPPSGVRIGDELAVGAVIGTVGDTEVRSPFAGTLMGSLAIEGERITTGQPVAWLRSEEN